MSRGIAWRVLAPAVIALSAAVPLAAQDAPSVAEAARRARQQKQESQKPAKVITNDTLPAAPPTNPPATPGDSAQPAPSSDSSAPADAGTETKKAAETPEEAEQKKAEIESLRKQIAAKQDEINTQKDLIGLDQTTYYSNPDYSRDTAGKTKLDAEKADLERMQQEMSELKARLEELGETVPSKAPEPRKSITQNAPQPQP